MTFLELGNMGSLNIGSQYMSAFSKSLELLCHAHTVSSYHQKYLVRGESMFQILYLNQAINFDDISLNPETCLILSEGSWLKVFAKEESLWSSPGQADPATPFYRRRDAQADRHQFGSPLRPIHLENSKYIRPNCAMYLSNC